MILDQPLPDRDPLRAAIDEHYRADETACVRDLLQKIQLSDDGRARIEKTARRFSIGIATAGSWFRQWRATGDLCPGRQGQPKRSKLDVYEAFILDLVADSKDIALHEIADRLAETHGLRVAPSTVWRFFAKCGITYKKRRRMRRNSGALTSSPGDRFGSTASSILSRSA